MSLIEDLDQLMMPYSCVYAKAHTSEEWQEIYGWLDHTCGKNKWYSDRNIFRFPKEEYLIMFKLRWL